METRPDLVHGAPQDTSRRARKPSIRAVLVAGALLTAVFAVVVSQFASSNPDGLEFVAEREGFADTATESPATGSPLADYGAGLTGTDTGDTAVAGLVGIAIVFAVGYGLFYLVRRGERGTPHAAAGGHVHALYHHGRSAVHRLPSHLKLVAGLGFVVGIVATPREAFWAFALYVSVLVALTVAARLRPSFVARRLIIEVPFVAVALLLPFFGGGEQTEILGISLSVPGLWTMWNILVKATLGLWASVILGATTPVPDLLAGLERLRISPPIVGIAGFMLRYVDVVLGQFGRMRRAMESRAYRPRSLRGARPIAAATGALFVRSYERGERVYLAMASRGYTGAMPPAGVATASGGAWAGAAALLLVTWAIAALAWVVR